MDMSPDAYGRGLLLAALVIVGALVLSRYRRFVASGRALRPLPPKSTRFRDMNAKAQLEGGVGAGFGVRDVYLWVSDGELAIETPFPFNLMADTLGAPVSERAPLANIKSVAILDCHVARVSYTSHSGETRTVRVNVKDSTLLETALRQ